jgi:hypothetical protein
MAICRRPISGRRAVAQLSGCEPTTIRRCPILSRRLRKGGIPRTPTNMTQVPDRPNPRLKLYLHPEIHRPGALKTLSTTGEIAQCAISIRFFREFHAPAGRQVPQIHPPAGIFFRKIPIRQFFPCRSARNPPPAGRRFRPMGKDGNPAQKTGAQPGCPPDTRLGARVAHPSHKNKVEARVGHQFLCSVEGSAYMPFCAFWPGWTTR